ncbi:type II toxin-antitoxin system death-on-curing family toxin [Alkaliphilus peptidifermentans]|uniref:Death on curing protein n=1 Tax=Alkaliphilus peptidifermentans DSM 18978 TaxID=1120976 RepID=A0A1G5LEB7_9FIRM|nr:type II toxin-antitoxin system death-on-curing family toxin [Alkaliphilus peptidifermentans]SCZ11156.1 death on curing protein [Alkaliphilus peptidifermentans DSM 18978]
MSSIVFIPKDVILFFHGQLIQLYGGSPGIRDVSLLESALEQPRATFDSTYLHDNIFKMAAAYGFHLCNNHPFIDGNKRISLVAMDIFLQRNGYEIVASEKETYTTIIQLSTGNLSKDELTQWLEINTAVL